MKGASNMEKRTFTPASASKYLKALGERDGPVISETLH